MKHTAIYLRVSSKQQNHASQMPDLDRWVAAHDGDGGAMAASSGTRTSSPAKRWIAPAWRSCLRICGPGKWIASLCWRLDRLGRTTRGLCQLFDELAERKVDLGFHERRFLVGFTSGRLHARILASVAEYETEVGPRGSLPVKPWQNGRGKNGAGQRRAGDGRCRMTKWPPSGNESRWQEGRSYCQGDWIEQADNLPGAGNCQPCEAPVIQRRNRFWKKSVSIA